MPLEIQNNFDQMSLHDLVQLRARGYSVLKSPHVGNQHPSNLVCAALGIPLEMVSFTQGVLDRNFHPHVRIQNGQQEVLCDARTWTQFASMSDGCSITEYHQSSVQQVFPQTEIMTDMQRMQQYPALAAIVLRATNTVVRGMWYRNVNSRGQVAKQTQRFLSEQALESEVFQFSNQSAGWVIPNRIHIVFDLVYQSLSSGRDAVYHLSGPQMVKYIDGISDELGLLYDAVRQYIPALPLTLKVRIVPVASARFVGLQSDASSIRAVCDVVASADLTHGNMGWYQELATAVPGVVTSIETGTTLSQYDLRTSNDLHIDPWMLNTPLATVNEVYRRLVLAAQAIAAE